MADENHQVKDTPEKARSWIVRGCIGCGTILMAGLAGVSYLAYVSFGMISDKFGKSEERDRVNAPPTSLSPAEMARLDPPNHPPLRPIEPFPHVPTPPTLDQALEVLEERAFRKEQPSVKEVLDLERAVMKQGGMEYLPERQKEKIMELKNKGFLEKREIQPTFVPLSR